MALKSKISKENVDLKKEKEEREKIEQELWANYIKNRTIENRNSLVEFYGDIVSYVAGRLSIGKPPNVEFDDLMSYGVLGLIDAIEKFDIAKGYKFITYGSMRVKGAILDAMRNYDWIPRAIRIKSRQLQNAYSELESRLGVIPDDQTVANYLNISLDQFYNMLYEISGTSQMSLDETWTVGTNADEITIMETIEAPMTDHPDVMLTREEIKKEIINTINSLPEKERLVLALYYYEGLTLREIGEVMELTESRASQLHAKAISIVKGRLVTNLGYTSTTN
ncbi:FliA/WhiG family RNA polymerase sigma factor [Candidatus Dependentiae bacterium]|nr:FliA/WhiG family RNA polymerase sigma factor [Candidatus Dependentiae bacterium]